MITSTMTPRISPAIAVFRPPNDGLRFIITNATMPNIIANRLNAPLNSVRDQSDMMPQIPQTKVAKDMAGMLVILSPQPIAIIGTEISNPETAITIKSQGSVSVPIKAPTIHIAMEIIIPAIPIQYRFLLVGFFLFLLVSAGLSCSFVIIYPY